MNYYWKDASKDNVWLEWGSSDNRDDIHYFFPHVEAGIYCTHIFLDLCLPPEKKEVLKI